MKKWIIAAISMSIAFAQPSTDAARWTTQARNIEIIRDDWGIAHVYGKTDADAVFGMIYAQAEDDFNRVETNYFNSMGRLAETEGESGNLSGSAHEAVHRSGQVRKQYAASPAWLKNLMIAWADGLEFLSMQASRT